MGCTKSKFKTKFDVPRKVQNIPDNKEPSATIAPRNIEENIRKDHSLEYEGTYMVEECKLSHPHVEGIVYNKSSYPVIQRKLYAYRLKDELQHANDFNAIPDNLEGEKDNTVNISPTTTHIGPKGIDSSNIEDQYSGNKSSPVGYSQAIDHTIYIQPITKLSRQNFAELNKAVSNNHELNMYTRTLWKKCNLFTFQCGHRMSYKVTCKIFVLKSTIGRIKIQEHQPSIEYPNHQSVYTHDEDLSPMYVPIAAYDLANKIHNIGNREDILGIYSFKENEDDEINYNISFE